MCSYASTICTMLFWILSSDLWTVSTENSENFTNCNSRMFLGFVFWFFLSKIKSSLWAVGLDLFLVTRGFVCSDNLKISLRIYPNGSRHLLQIKYVLLTLLEEIHQGGNLWLSHTFIPLVHPKNSPNNLLFPVFICSRFGQFLSTL